MSSRALRRLERERGLPLTELPPSNSSDDEPLHPSNHSNFALLAESEDELVDAKLEPEVGQLPPHQKELQNTTEPKNKRKSNKSKQKRGVEAAGQPSTKDQNFDVDELLDQLVIENKHPIDKKESSRDYTKALELFIVDLDHLDPALEMRRKIGGVDAAEKDSTAESSQLPDDIPPAIANQIMVNLKKHNRQLRRYRTQLIVPRPTWTRVTSSLVELGLERFPEHHIYGSAAFRLAPTMSYDGQFEEFAILVESGNIQLLYEFARKHPLHVDTLLVVSDFLRISSNSEASELTERALYILEKCTLATSESSVGLTMGTMRLPYDYFENRRMHLALLRHVQFLTKRGCYRTALEFSKILWSLDPLVDPLGVRMIADFLAVQSGQYAWFETVYNEIAVEAPWLANWHFSQALMYFVRGHDGVEKATQLLQQAILSNPWMIPRLADACGLQIDEDAWRNSFDIPLLPAFDHVGALREAQAKIYAQRCGPVWKSPKCCAWLENTLGTALSAKLSTPEAFPMQDFRPTLFEAAPIFRHSLISDLNSVQVALPVTIASGSIRPYDPLPPEEIFEEDKRQYPLGKCSIQ